MVLVSLLPILNAAIPTVSLPPVTSLPSYPLSAWRSFTSKTVAVAPNSSEVSQVMDIVVNMLNITSTLRIAYLEVKVFEKNID